MSLKDDLPFTNEEEEDEDEVPKKAQLDVKQKLFELRLKVVFNNSKII
jgi:hypothetical protein